MAATNNSILDAVEKSLGTCAILPQQSGEDDFGLFRALQVKLGEDGRAEFTPLRIRIDENFLREWGLSEKIEALQGFLGRAEKGAKLKDIKQSLGLSTKLAGNMGVELLEPFNAKSHYHVAIEDMKRTSIAQTIGVKNFLEDCVPAFCNKSGILAGPERNQGWFDFGSKKIEYGLAFVTSYITGSLVVAADKTDVGVVTGVVAEGKRHREIDSDGIIGIRVYFVHLVKNENDGSIKMLNLFPVNKSNDERLKIILKRMAAKGFMKLFEPKDFSEDSECTVKFRMYPTKEEFVKSHAHVRRKMVDREDFVKSRAHLQQIVNDRNDQSSLSRTETGDNYTEEPFLLTDESTTKLFK